MGLIGAIIKIIIVMFLLFLSFFTSGHPEVFCKKDVLKNFAKFTGKHLHKNALKNTLLHGTSLVAASVNSFYMIGALTLHELNCTENEVFH